MLGARASRLALPGRASYGTGFSVGSSTRSRAPSGCSAAGVAAPLPVAPGGPPTGGGVGAVSLIQSATGEVSPYNGRSAAALDVAAGAGVVVKTSSSSIIVSSSSSSSSTSGGTPLPSPVTVSSLSI